MTAPYPSLQARSFYATVPGYDDDLLLAYLQFLEERNGPAEGPDAFVRREARMAELAVSEPNASFRIDPERFARNHEKFDGEDLTAEEVAVLAFVKVNSGEAYGVQVMREARKGEMSGDAPFARVYRTIAREEDYHTRLLVGAVDHFAGVDVTAPFEPDLALRVLIGALARFPKSMYHPVLIGAELAGIFDVNWLLTRVKRLFPNDPAVRESMEERLIDILIDEVGHVTFNRVAVGPVGMKFGRYAGAAVVAGVPNLVPELVALGFDAHERSRFWGFDFEQLPEEVRTKSFLA